MSMLRDPEDKSVSPATLLGVPESASLRDINDAFAALMKDPARKKDLREAMEARRRLTDPVERLALAFFTYDLDDLADRAKIEEGIRARRHEDLLSELGAHERENPEDARLHHTLAVLAWWHAARVIREVGPGSPKMVAPAIQTALEAVARVIHALHLPATWERFRKRTNLPLDRCGPDEFDRARQRILEEIASWAVKLEAEGPRVETKRPETDWGAIRAEFEIEKLAAEALAALPAVPAIQPAPVCGPRMARILEATEAIEARLQAGDLSPAQIARIRELLSPMGRGQRLVESGQLDEAEAFLESRPAPERKSKGAISLQARIELARAVANISNDATLRQGMAGFLTAAKLAKRAGGEILPQVLNACHAAATEWINCAEYDQVIDLLQPVHELSKSQKIQDLLVVSLTDRASIRVKQGKEARDIEVLLRGVADIEWVLDLDPCYPRAVEGYPIVVGLLSQELASAGHVDAGAEAFLAFLKGRARPTEIARRRMAKVAPKRRPVVVRIRTGDRAGGFSYTVPQVCACCLSPNAGMTRQISDTTQEDNIRRTMSMEIPYCHACSKHWWRATMRIGLAVFFWIALAIVFLACIYPQFPRELRHQTPFGIGLAIWGLHALAATAISIRAARLLVPKDALGPDHAAEDAAATIMSFSPVHFDVLFRNPGFGIRFAQANRSCLAGIT
ncbi:MAG: hypothetical protein HY720_09120 [Planctomycetes bacterium]|nr:hypothetical protein [Planctomycetota bacterium]